MSIDTLMDWGSATSVKKSNPKRVNYIIYEGDTWIDTIPIVDEAGSPVNLIGQLIVLTIKKSKYQKRPDVQLSSNTNLTVSGISANQIGIRTILTIPPGTYQYDIEITNTNGSTITYRNGTIKIIKEV